MVPGKSWDRIFGELKSQSSTAFTALSLSETTATQWPSGLNMGEPTGLELPFSPTGRTCEAAAEELKSQSFTALSFSEAAATQRPSGLMLPSVIVIGLVI